LNWRRTKEEHIPLARGRQYCRRGRHRRVVVQDTEAERGCIKTDESEVCLSSLTQKILILKDLLCSYCRVLLCFVYFG